MRLLPDNTNLTGLYLLMQVMVLFLFCVPLLGVYIAFRREDLLLQPILTQRVGAFRFYLFLLFSVWMSVLYFSALVRGHLLFRRLGSQGLAAAVLDLPPWLFVIIRVFDRMSASLLAPL